MEDEDGMVTVAVVVGLDLEACVGADGETDRFLVQPYMEFRVGLTEGAGGMC